MHPSPEVTPYEYHSLFLPFLLLLLPGKSLLLATPLPQKPQHGQGGLRSEKWEWEAGSAIGKNIRFSSTMVMK